MKNDYNQYFYNTLSIDKFKQRLSTQRNLSQHHDIKVILQMIKRYEKNISDIRISEFGAGIGRVIDGLRKEKFSGYIYAYERSEFYYNLLLKQYGKRHNLFLFKSDILCDEIHESDYALLLWSVLAEFNFEEQERLLLKISFAVKKGIFIDLPFKETNETSICCDTNADNDLIIFLPSDVYMRKLINKLQLKINNVYYYNIAMQKRLVYFVTI